MTSVLLAEDDVSISDPLARALRREGYLVSVSADAAGTLEAALAGGVDLLVLDLGLPRLDGLEVCRRLRSEGHTVPVLILTARADEVDTVIGLDAGADDYVTKPFDLLRMLVNEAGKVVTRDQIMHEVWGDRWWGSTKTLDMHISWLRRKLGDDAQQPSFITTVRGVGFRFERDD